MPAAIEDLKVTLQLVAAFRRRQSRYRQPHCFFGSVAVETFGGAIPAGDGAIRTGTVNCVRRVFHDGSHLAGGTIGARFRQCFLPGHAPGEHGNGKESRQLLQVSLRADAEAEVGRNSEEIQASGGDQRTENGGAKAEKTSGEEAPPPAKAQRGGVAAREKEPRG